MASLRHFSTLTKNSLCSNSFASIEKCSDGLFILESINLYLKSLENIRFISFIRKICNKFIVYIEFSIKSFTQKQKGFDILKIPLFFTNFFNKKFQMLIQIFSIACNNFFIPVKWFLLASLQCSISIIISIYIDKSVTFFHFSSSCTY